MDIYKNRIRPLFEKSGLNDRELEEALELPRGVIYKWGTGKYKSYRNYIPKIAAYFHVSADYLLGNTDDPKPVGQKEKPAHNVDELDEETKELRVIWDTSDADERQALLEMARLIKKRRDK